MADGCLCGYGRICEQSFEGMPDCGQSTRRFSSKEEKYRRVPKMNEIKYPEDVPISISA